MPASGSTSTVPHPREVDHQAVVDRAVAGGVVAAAPDRDLETFAWPKASAAATSSASTQRAIAAGRRSISRLKQRRARSYSRSPRLEDVARQRIAELVQRVSHRREDSAREKK